MPMIRSSRQLIAALLLALAVLTAGTGAVAANTITGPSSSQPPYLVRAVPGVVTKAILTVGDTPAGSAYQMVGIPDGLGAFDNGDGTFTVLMNHELANTAGVVRAHGAKGAFVSKWVINKDDLSVVSGEDLIKTVNVWNTTTQTYDQAAATFSRFCSANLAPLSAFYNSASGLGYNGRIFMNGEETGSEGRAFAHLMNGTSYELPRMGKFSWENTLANPASGNKTVVIGTDDSTPGQLYVYVGTKASSGSPVERAGLTNGSLYGVKVAGIPVESRNEGIATGTAFSLYGFGDVSNWSGTQLDTKSNDNDVTRFLRPEDGAWDPRNPNDFYFVTTDRFSTPASPGRSRLWRLHFSDLGNPAAGGTIDMLLDGTEGQQMLDNLTLNRHGQVFIQEDPGNQPHVAKVWRYDVASDTLSLVAQHDPDRFAPGAPNFLTQDEESSGIIDASDILGEGWFLLDVQAHYPTTSELVESGQLLALHYPPGKK